MTIPATGGHIGYTGTRETPTIWQGAMVENLLRYHRALGFVFFHHGDCAGADEFAAWSAAKNGYIVICHPPTNETLRAYTTVNHITEPPLPYLKRNDAIVAAATAGIAVPNSDTPRSGSGTWSTIDKFYTKRIPYWVVAPDRCWSVVHLAEETH